MSVPFINYTKSSIKSILEKHSRLSSAHIERIQAASHVYPFRANNYVVENLINWNNVPNDPIFRLTFPQPEMLLDDDMDRILHTMRTSGDSNDIINREAIRRQALQIRKEMNPHPAKQKEMNVPTINMDDGAGNVRVPGVQHKYRETLLFFPSEAQWCHAYCTYCFRWAQFTEVGSEQQFKSKDIALLTKYIKDNKQITDILFTGGDPAVMKTAMWQKYLSPFIDPKNAADFEHLNTIRIGTKSLTYWPYRYTHNEDSDDFLRLLERVNKSGKHVTIQAHFTHPQELATPQVEEAVRRLRMTGCNIRSQAPIVAGINDDASVWAEMWKKQVSMGIVPYYMFIERDTGPKHYFELPLVRAHQIFKDAVSRVSGVARTVRGPSMSCEPGKISVMGVIDDMIMLQFLQARNPQWMKNPFLAKYDENATWIDELTPYNGADSFFYQQEFDNMSDSHLGLSSGQMSDELIDQHFKPFKQSSMLNMNGKGINGKMNGKINGKVNGVGVKRENVVIMKQQQNEKKLQSNH